MTMLRLPETPKRKRVWALVAVYSCFGALAVAGALWHWSGNDKPADVITNCEVARAWLDDPPTLAQLRDVETHC